MYQQLLSVLLLGLVPAPVSQQGAPPIDIHIAAPVDAIHIASHLSASGVVILDAKSGQQLFARQSNVRRPMASLTKLMTALIIAENHDLDDWVEITKAAELVDGNKAHIAAGEYYTVGDLLSALLISSANDAAEALAIHHSGDVPSFVQEMNERAAILGLHATSFMNPAGLDHPRQWSTPRDIAWLTAFAMRNDDIAKRMGIRGTYITSKDGTRIDILHTHNLMHKTKKVIAGKTGTTDAAGQCLVSLLEEGDNQYFVVLMNSLQRYTDMGEIVDTLQGAVTVAKR